MKNMETEIRLIRHGPKATVTSHFTGIEAQLEPSGIPLIEEYARSFMAEREGYYFVVESHRVPRNDATRQIIAKQLIAGGARVESGIEDKLGPYRGAAGNIILLPPELPKIWGAAEKADQTVECVAKEDRGLYSWANAGMDNDFGTGISLREVAYRLGDYVLKAVEFAQRSDSPRLVVGISNSGFIEFLNYAILDSLEGSKPCVERIKETGGALRPLTGLSFFYTKGSDHIDLESGGKKLMIPGEIFEKQREWLSQYGKAEQVLAERLR
jgi:hypothetical protein